MASNGLQVRLLEDGMAAIARDAWNRLGCTGFPCLRHEFLLALEEGGCLGDRVGWFPLPLTLTDPSGELLAALPLYLKSNSFGEFVFDWAWAEAHERAGRTYYPKLVAASPFTPATGPRLLVRPDLREPALVARLIGAAIEAARSLGVSSLHWLFPTDDELTQAPGLLRRTGCQFHWENPGYQSFEHFLAALTAKRRKEIQRERRRVREAGVELVPLAGEEVSAREWAAFHALYRDTFDRHGNFPALTLAFFRQLAATLGSRVRLVLARRAGEIVAAAYFLVGDDALYGRYWGCREEIPGLHFEACYYQGIEFCIARGLRRFEPGAQGEHKISRGFLPARTASCHWLAHEDFRAPVARFLQREAAMMDDYIRRMGERSPYRQA
ncbi:GNAT family N-acetyltransferase [Methyloparacoccus murrellii]